MVDVEVCRSPGEPIDYGARRQISGYSTVVGVSENCCAIPTAFVEGINNSRAKEKLSECHLPRSHGTSNFRM
jgi:hypothetical protein